MQHIPLPLAVATCDCGLHPQQDHEAESSGWCGPECLLALNYLATFVGVVDVGLEGVTLACLPHDCVGYVTGLSQSPHESSQVLSVMKVL